MALAQTEGTARRRCVSIVPLYGRGDWNGGIKSGRHRGVLDACSRGCGQPQLVPIMLDDAISHEEDPGHGKALR